MLCHPTYARDFVLFPMRCRHIFGISSILFHSYQVFVKWVLVISECRVFVTCVWANHFHWQTKRRWRCFISINILVSIGFYEITLNCIARIDVYSDQFFEMFPICYLLIQYSQVFFSLLFACQGILSTVNCSSKMNASKCILHMIQNEIKLQKSSFTISRKEKTRRQ